MSTKTAWGGRWLAFGLAKINVGLRLARRRPIGTRGGLTPGHALPGVEGIYDRHSYEAEIGDALHRLAVQIQKILNPADAALRQKNKGRLDL